MRVRYFTHSITSCWNHGNAHFLRGVLRELARRGHDVLALEPLGGWSRSNLVADQGVGAVERFDRLFSDIRYQVYDEARADLDRLTDRADVVIVHEWTAPRIVSGLARLRRTGAPFLLLFHDTHHRAASDPASLPLKALEAFDGILAFGESLVRTYDELGFAGPVVAWHEAADTEIFRPLAAPARSDVAWVGNWGDEERTEELETFLFGPVAALGLGLAVRGVRYPEAALRRLGRIGATYEGWIANADVPALFAASRFTVHVPRRLYLERLPGIPTIRMFEALACGLPLICALWRDTEGLFRPGMDYVVARDGEEMTRLMRSLAADAGLRAELSRNGLETIRARHTCRHRVDELFTIIARLKPDARAPLAEAI